MARAAYGVALRNFDWAAIGEKQRALLEATTHCPRVSFRVVMPFLISTCSVTCRPPFSTVIE